VLGKIVQDGVKGIFLSNDSMLFNERKRLANLALEHRPPLLLQNRPGALAGALMSMGQIPGQCFIVQWPMWIRY
jgi:hypothetical protein